MVVRLVVRRLFFLIFVLLGLSIITFTLSHVVPGDPARLMAGPRASKATVAKIREKYGLDDPVPTQYVNYVKGVLRGDLGDSFTSRRPVKEDLKKYLPATLELGFSLRISSPRARSRLAVPTPPFASKSKCSSLN